MELREIGEFGFIRRVSRGCLVRPEGVERAIGDDAAAFVVPSDELTLVTTDLLVERVHFLRDATTPFNLGHKAMAVNLSDIAAMGGIPREAFVSTAIPAGCPVEYLDGLYDGMKSLAARHGVNILGGDTTGSVADLIVNVTVVGHVRVMRCCIAPGPDQAISCASPARSEIAAPACISFWRSSTPSDAAMRTLFDAHILPRPHLEEGRFLAATRAATAALDLSDGLSSDLMHIVEESGVGIRVHADRIPISAELREFCAGRNRDPFRFALAGGEDYVLAVTVRPDRIGEVGRDFAARFGRPLHCIGEATDSGHLEFVTPDGQTEIVRPTGWDHFGEHGV